MLPLQVVSSPSHLPINGQIREQENDNQEITLAISDSSSSNEGDTTSISEVATSVFSAFFSAVKTAVKAVPWKVGSFSTKIMIKQQYLASDGSLNVCFSKQNVSQKVVNTSSQITLVFLEYLVEHLDGLIGLEDEKKIFLKALLTDNDVKKIIQGLATGNINACFSSLQEKINVHLSSSEKVGLVIDQIIGHIKEYGERYHQFYALVSKKEHLSKEDIEKAFSSCFLGFKHKAMVRFFDEEDANKKAYLNEISNRLLKILFPQKEKSLSILPNAKISNAVNYGTSVLGYDTQKMIWGYLEKYLPQYLDIAFKKLKASETLDRLIDQIYFACFLNQPEEENPIAIHESQQEERITSLEESAYVAHHVIESRNRVVDDDFLSGEFRNQEDEEVEQSDAYILEGVKVNLKRNLTPFFQQAIYQIGPNLSELVYLPHAKKQIDHLIEDQVIPSLFHYIEKLDDNPFFISSLLEKGFQKLSSNIRVLLDAQQEELSSSTEKTQKMIHLGLLKLELKEKLLKQISDRWESFKKEHWVTSFFQTAKGKKVIKTFVATTIITSIAMAILFPKSLAIIAGISVVLLLVLALIVRSIMKKIERFIEGEEKKIAEKIFDIIKGPKIDGDEESYAGLIAHLNLIYILIDDILGSLTGKEIRNYH